MQTKDILQTVKCIQCECILQSPVFLPCGISICQKHITEQNSNVFYCQTCHSDHIVPDTGFAPNNAVIFLIDFNLVDYKKAKNACHSLKSNIDELSSIKIDPHAHIERVLGELKHEIRSKRDALIVEIKTKSDKMINELEIYTNECKSSLDNDLITSMFANVEDGIARNRVKLEEWLNELPSLQETSQANWKSILEKCEVEKNNLTAFAKKMRGHLFREKLDEYKMKSDILRYFKPENNQSQINKSSQQINGSSSRNGSLNGSALKVTQDSDSGEDEGDDLPNCDNDYGSDSDEDEHHEEYDDADSDIQEIFPSSSETESSKSEKQPVRLTKTQAERIFNRGDKTLKCFATRLIRRYFTPCELSRRDVTICGRGKKQQLDPIRVGYIKSHLVDFNGGRPLTDKQWIACKVRMACTFRRKRYPDSHENIMPDLDDKKNKITRLSDAEVEKTFNNGRAVNFNNTFQNGTQSLKNFAGRLFTRYFTKQELVKSYKPCRGAPKRTSFDPVRVDFIKSHLVKYNDGRPLTNEQWSECKLSMTSMAWHMRKRYLDAQKSLKKKTKK